MFGFGKKRAAPGRKEFRDEFETMTMKLRGADASVQMAVGHSINMAFGLFRQAHGSPQAFIRWVLSFSPGFAFWCCASFQLFCKQCAASVVQWFFTVCARRQFGASRFGFWV